MLDDGADWTGLFKIAVTNRKVYDFIQTYPEVIEDVRVLLGQPKAASVHASAIIVTPKKRDSKEADCFDFLPIRKMDGALVSEFDGYSVDEIGLLKEDVMATKELAKLSATINLVNEHYNQQLTIEKITSEMLDDEKTYRILSEGNTQNVFQFSSPGITRFIQDVQPNCIEDLIAINALFRPATLDIGATNDYVRYRRGDVTPVYNFGCYEATKNTYGIMVYQEQFMSVAHTPQHTLSQHSVERGSRQTIRQHSIPWHYSGQMIKRCLPLCRKWSDARWRRLCRPKSITLRWSSSQTTR